LLYNIETPIGTLISPPENGWRWSEVELKKKIQTGEVIFNNECTRIIRKIYLKNQDGRTPENLWADESSGTTRQATQEIKDLFEQSVPFDTPKPTKLLTKINKLLTPECDYIILDFFAGSSTTAHAVMQLNAADGGNRRFIMVQLPEVCPPDSEAAKSGFPTIAEISKERLRRAGAQVLTAWQANQTAPSTQNFLAEEPPRTPPDVGFRVLTVDSTNMHEVFYRPDSLVQGQLSLLSDNIKPDRSSLDLLFQVMLDWGVDLGLPITQQTLHDKQIYTVADGVLVACFDTGIDEVLVRALAQMQPLRVVFRDSGFVDDATKINVSQIFSQLSPRTDIRVL
jgi:adenine-specific DNA-methyltransferase